MQRSGWGRGWNRPNQTALIACIVILEAPSLSSSCDNNGVKPVHVWSNLKLAFTKLLDLVIINLGRGPENLMHIFPLTGCKGALECQRHAILYQSVGPPESTMSYYPNYTHSFSRTFLSGKLFQLEIFFGHRSGNFPQIVAGNSPFVSMVFVISHNFLSESS